MTVTIDGTTGETTPATKYTGSTSGTITLQAAAVAGTNTVTVAAQTGTLNVAGPAFHATAAGSQTLTSNTATKILFATEDFDTNNNFASSTFTPTVAGYYQITVRVQVQVGTTANYAIAYIYKNGVVWSQNQGAPVTSTSMSALVTDIVYCNGTTDYIDGYGNAVGTGTLTVTASSFFSGCLLRGA